MIPRHLGSEFFGIDSNGNPNKIADIIARRRLKQYYRWHIIDRFFVDPGLNKGSSPQYVTLDVIGAMILAGWWGCTMKELKWKKERNDVQIPYLAHIIEINSFREWLVNNAKVAGHLPGVWKVEHHNYVSFEMDELNYRLEPDGYCQYWFNKEDGFHFFYEHDRGTMSLKQWKEKIARYQLYFDSRHWQKDSELQFPIVLCTTTTWKRTEELSALCAETNVVWFFTSYENGFTDEWIESSTEGKIQLFNTKDGA